MKRSALEPGSIRDYETSAAGRLAAWARPILVAGAARDLGIAPGPRQRSIDAALRACNWPRNHLLAMLREPDAYPLSVNALRQIWREMRQ